MQRLDLILLVAGAVGAGAVIIGLVLVGITSGLWYRATRELPAPPTELETGVWTRTGAILPSLRWMPLVHVDLHWTQPDAEVGFDMVDGQAWERVRPWRRADVRQVVRRVTISDVFGFCQIRLHRRTNAAVVVLPSAGMLGRMRVLHAMSAGSDLSHPTGPPQGDAIDLRPYAPGDPVRKVLWKVFARSRKLVVRTPERAVSPVRQTLAFMVSGPEDESSAGAARAAVETGALGDEWILGADGSTATTSDVDDALRLLARSANTAATGHGAQLAPFLAGSPTEGRRIILFAPSRPGPWLQKAVAAVRNCSGDVEFVVAFDALDRSDEDPRWKRWLFASQAGSSAGSSQGSTRLDELRQVARALMDAGADVTLVDRQQARVYPAIQILHKERAA
jgi:hypothetical protein